ncbi:hypothetical protein EVAR_45080_1 [Eumeta japonica]|uniref:Uncharacterized protein n=1 Tax=Eumeta variegata TaxID=151549 RepID=A0A4C1XYG0_EUMVA|nr:hypothetical protein EVAR_45080_1 [Eumeta japonica]
MDDAWRKSSRHRMSQETVTSRFPSLLPGRRRLAAAGWMPLLVAGIISIHHYEFSHPRRTHAGAFVTHPTIACQENYMPICIGYPAPVTRHPASVKRD